MALARNLIYREIPVAMPYSPSGLPIGNDPKILFVDFGNVVYVQQGEDVWIEKRFGFAKLIGSIANLEMRTIFSYRKKNGNMFVVVYAHSSSLSAGKVSKRQWGLDSDFVTVDSTNFGSTPMSMAQSNDTLYMSNGSAGSAKKYDGTNFQTWGIAIPTTVPTETHTTGTSISATVGYRYVYCYSNNTTGHLGSPSPASASTGVFTSKDVTVTGPRSTDLQVDKVRIFRTVDGSGGIFFEISGSPIANPGAGNWSIVDTTTDANLSSKYAPVNSTNDPPPAMIALTVYAGRIFGASNNTVYYSSFEESTLGTTGLFNGVPEESFPPANKFIFSDVVRGIAPVSDGLLMFLPSQVWKLTGDSRATFNLRLLFDGIGLQAQRGITSAGKMVYWFSTDHTIRRTDGFAQEEIGSDVRSQFKSSTHDNISLCYHRSVQFEYICIYDVGNSNQLHVYDLKLSRWLPRWTLIGMTVTNGVVASIEYSPVSPQNDDREFLLVMARNQLAVSQRGASETADYRDTVDGLTFTNLAADFATTQIELFPQAPGRVGTLEYVGIETDGTLPSSVSAWYDELPTTGTMMATLAARNPPLRTQGTNLKETWYDARNPGIRRVALYIIFPQANANFKLYKLFLASLPMQTV